MAVEQHPVRYGGEGDGRSSDEQVWQMADMMGSVDLDG